MELYTSRTLYDKWNKLYETKKDRIKQLKEKQNTIGKELDYIQMELEELLVEVNLIHHLLADLGVMVYVEESKTARNSN